MATTWMLSPANSSPLGYQSTGREREGPKGLVVDAAFRCASVFVCAQGVAAGAAGNGRPYRDRCSATIPRHFAQASRPPMLSLCLTPRTFTRCGSDSAHEIGGHGASRTNGAQQRFVEDRDARSPFICDESRYSSEWRLIQTRSTPCKCGSPLGGGQSIM